MATSNQDAFSPDAIALLCVEFWKLAKATEKATQTFTDGAGRKLEGQLKYSNRQLTMLLSQLGLKLIEFDGEQYHAGLPTSADNAEDFDDETELIIAKTLEPTVMEGMKVLRSGRVIVQRAKNSKE